jgi:hypothetical protein
LDLHYRSTDINKIINSMSVIQLFYKYHMMEFPKNTTPFTVYTLGIVHF